MRRRRGQVLLEFAISMFGVVAFMFVILKTWGWMSATILQRQEVFQQSRLAAGQDSSYQPVGYQRPALSLIGPMSSAGGPPGKWEPPIDVPTASPCADADQVFAASVELMEDATALFEQAKAQLEPLTTQLKAAEERIAQLQQEIPPAQAVVDGLTAQIAGVDAQLAGLHDQHCFLFDAGEGYMQEYCEPAYYEKLAPLNAQKAQLQQQQAAAEQVLAGKQSELSQKQSERDQLRSALAAKTQQVLPLIQQAQQTFEAGQAELERAREICGL